MDKIGISSSAFIDQSTITSVKFGSSCTFVGNDAFKNCKYLSEINNDNVIEEIGHGAFAGCENLTHVDMSKCISISNEAFSGCKKLTYINIPSCSNIGNAFSGCENLKSVKLNKNIIDGIDITIESLAFSNCSKLKDIDFTNCKIIGKQAFMKCTSLENANLNKIGCKIRNSAFCGCENLKQITLSDAEVIGSYAFLNCNKLSRVYINAKSIIEDLGSYAFFCTKNNDTSESDLEYSIIDNIKFYLGEDIFDQYTEHGYWGVYSSHMIKLPGANEILYTTANNKKISDENINTKAYGGMMSNTYKNNIGRILFKKTITKLENIFKSKTELNCNSIDKTELTSINLPADCTGVGDREFEGCRKLSAFTPSPIKELTEIGEYAFKDCESLTSFTIPESLNEIGDGAFAGCKGIKNFEGKFVSYNGKAIVYNKKLICILPEDDNETEGRIYNISDIDKTITKLGKSCFHGCEKLRRLNIPSKITSIDNNAFVGCTNLCEIHFSSETTPKKISLGANIFGENIREDLKIFVPEKYFEIYYKNIFKSSDYKDYIYPKPNYNQIIYYGENQLNTVTSTPVKIDGNIKYYKIDILSSIQNNIPKKYFYNKDTVEEVLIGEKITKIDTDAFKNCEKLKYIYLPDTIKNFEDECFYCCKSLTKIHIPNTKIQNTKKGTTTFGKNIFYGCDNLKEFDSYYSDFVSDDNRCYIDGGVLKFFAQSDIKEYTIPENVTKINNHAFRGTSIESIVIGESTKTIGEYAFEGCENLKYVNTESYSESDSTGLIKLNNIETIQKYAFANCTSINKVATNKLKTINEHVFKGCTSLTEVELGCDTETIDKGAFYGCKILENINILVDENKTSNLKSIGQNAFYECGSLNMKNLFSIIGSVESIGNNAFENCSLNLYNTITIPNSVSSIGTNCFKNSGIEKIYINDGSKLTEIPNYAFYECKKLKEVNISNSKLTSIGDSAFENCNNIPNITLPNSISKLGNHCFAFNTNKINITIPISLNVPPTFAINGINKTDSNPFGDVENLNIYIPRSLVNRYANNEYWEKYDENFKYITQEVVPEIK